jgi:hypothetical protein
MTAAFVLSLMHGGFGGHPVYHLIFANRFMRFLELKSGIPLDPNQAFP